MMKEQDPPRQPWETVEYTDAPDFPGYENLELVEDFLPTPADLAKTEEVVRVTLALNRQSVEYFKEVAKAEGVPYQRMIRNLVAEYANKHRGKPHRKSTAKVA